MRIRYDDLDPRVSKEASELSDELLCLHPTFLLFVDFQTDVATSLRT